MAKEINGINFNDLSIIEGLSSKFEKISFPGISSESDCKRIRFSI